MCDLVNNLGKDKLIICSVGPLGPLGPLGLVLEFTDIILFKDSPSPSFLSAQREYETSTFALMVILCSNYAKTFIFLYQTLSAIF